MNAKAATCETCRCPIPADAPEGLCPACVVSDLVAPLLESDSTTVPLNEDTESIVGYRLAEKIGEGGYGEVFRARQESPRRDVAIKILKAGMDSRQILARFDAEQRALAVLDHESISGVYASGMTTKGRPYFAMPLSDGIPITEYCAANRLSLREKLLLFLRVCEGVSHAHQKAIVHRDLKPSNILVEGHPEGARPRIIDFGIAKALDEPLTEHTVFTRSGFMLGTPEYMSPEQARGGLGVDTRSDVYSLGAILYELLAGKPPLEFSATSPPTAVLEILESKNPTRPSSLAGGKIPEDLDWIVLRALEKTCERRYQSAQDLSDDIRRHLAHEPVRARPPSQLYRLGRYARRNRGTVAAGALLLLAIAVGTTISVVMAVRASLAEVRTRQAFRQSDLSSSRHLLEAGRPADAAAYLCRSLRSDPGHPGAGTRLVELLTTSDFALPVCAPLPLGDPGQGQATFTPDGSRIITISAGGQVRVWDATSGEQLATAEGAPTPLQGKIEISADSRRLVLFGGTPTRKAQIFDATSAQLLGEFSAEAGTSMSCATLSVDGQTLVAGFLSGTLRAWDIETGNSLWTNSDGGRYGKALLCAGEETSRLVACIFASGQIRLFATRDGELRGEWHGARVEASFLEFAKRGDRILHAANHYKRRLASSYTSFASRKRRETAWLKHHDIIHDLEPFAEGRLLATGCEDGLAFVWDSNNGKLIKSCLFSHPRAVTSLSWGPGGAVLATGCADGGARLWNLEIWTDLGRRGLARTIHHLVGVCDVAFSPTRSGHLLVVTTDGRAHLWDVRRRSAIYPGDQPTPPGDFENLPSWFLDLAEALVNRTLTSSADLETVGFERWQKIQREVLARKGDSSLDSLARWLVAPNENRPIHPGSEISREAHARSLVESGALDSLLRANALDPLNPHVLEAIAHRLLGNSAKYDDNEGRELRLKAVEIRKLTP